MTPVAVAWGGDGLSVFPKVSILQSGRLGRGQEADEAKSFVSILAPLQDGRWLLVTFTHLPLIIIRVQSRRSEASNGYQQGPDAADSTATKKRTAGPSESPASSPRTFAPLQTPHTV